MSSTIALHCVVDDTALTTNITEIENWVSQGSVVLIIPLYTLERLHLLKKDASQIGQNARKAVKFLDRMTSEKLDLPVDPIILQGPDEQYATWEEVEAHYKEETTTRAQVAENKECLAQQQKKEEAEKALKRASGGALSQMLLDKLNFVTLPGGGSPRSTPPMSPSSSELQSSKTSPEVKVATLNAVEKSPVPSALKALLNPVIWYVHEKSEAQTQVFFLTNSADTQHLARDFDVPTKTIHQLRSAVGEGSLKPERIHRKRRSTSSLPGSAETEGKTLFSYEDEKDESDEEEVVFKPRGRGGRGGFGRGGSHGSMRNKTPNTRSPRLSFSTPTAPPSTKPQIPIEEIDPDSFDRGSFGRGSVPLANTGVGNHAPNHFNGFPRGPSHRGFSPAGPSRGMNYYRGGGQGLDRGTVRGRGRLFVP